MVSVTPVSDEAYVGNLIKDLYGKPVTFFFKDIEEIPTIEHKVDEAGQSALFIHRYLLDDPLFAVYLAHDLGHIGDTRENYTSWKGLVTFRQAKRELRADRNAMSLLRQSGRDPRGLLKMVQKSIIDRFRYRNRHNFFTHTYALLVHLPRWVNFWRLLALSRLYGRRRTGKC